MSTQVRQHIERELATETIRVLLAASPTYSISVTDGNEGWPIEQSRDPEAILREMFSMDDDGLFVYCSADTKRFQRYSVAELPKDAAYYAAGKAAGNKVALQDSVHGTQTKRISQ